MTDDPKDPTTRSKTSESAVHEDGPLSPPLSLWAVSSWMVARFTACRLSMNREMRIAVRLGIRSRQSADAEAEGILDAQGSENAMTLLSRRTSGVAIWIFNRSVRRSSFGSKAYAWNMGDSRKRP